MGKEAVSGFPSLIVSTTCLYNQTTKDERWSQLVERPAQPNEFLEQGKLLKDMLHYSALNCSLQQWESEDSEAPTVPASRSELMVSLDCLMPVSGGKLVCELSGLRMLRPHNRLKLPELCSTASHG